MRVMPCQEISDVIVCKFHIIFICGGVMRWIASEIYYRGQRESNWGEGAGGVGH